MLGPATPWVHAPFSTVASFGEFLGAPETEAVLGGNIANCLCCYHWLRIRRVFRHLLPAEVCAWEVRRELIAGLQQRPGDGA
eukprot:7469636-Lingulodinium_polyedra.AAC.1